MTTYAYSAKTITMNTAGTLVRSVAISQVTITTQNDDAHVWFDQYIYGPDDYETSLNARIFVVRVNGAIVDPSSVNVSYLTWSGGTATVITIENDPVTTVVQIDGDPLPLNTLAETRAWEAEVDGNPVPAGTEYSPGQEILLSSFLALTGISENDNIIGTAFNDTRIYLTDGNDRMLGGDGNDEIYGGNDQDSLFGDGGEDTLYGDAGRDRLTGGSGYDRLYGGADNDTLMGEDDDDGLYGGDGRDLLQGGNGSDGLYGEEGNDTLEGGAGNDWRLDGGEGNDSILGGAGSDFMRGQGGNDTLNGELGNDDMAGGIGADRFVFGASMGRDLVRDFDVLQGDRLQIAAALVGNQSGLTAAQVFSQYGTDLGDALVFNFAGGARLTLLGVADVTELGDAFLIV